jgi:hypothetical protein
MSLSKVPEVINSLKDQKILFSFWRIIFRWIRNIISRINFRNPSFESLNPSYTRKPIYYVTSPLISDSWLMTVAGDHTRTISVAAPTVGGLMKFAVKTQTCLGCKTPLPKGPFLPIVGWLTVRCESCGLSELYSSCGRIVSEIPRDNK